VRLILAPQHRRALVVVEVKLAVRQAHCALTENRGEYTRILCVWRGAEREKRWKSVVAETRRKPNQLLTVADGIDLAEQWFERLRPPRLDRLLIHAGGIGVANLLLVRRPVRRRERRVFEDVADDAGVAIGELVQTAVARPVGGHWIGDEPLAAGELIEVGTSVDAAIEVADAEAFRRRGGRLRGDWDRRRGYHEGREQPRSARSKQLRGLRARRRPSWFH